MYGADKVCAHLNREQIRAARCTIERLMRDIGLSRVMRRKKHRTTITDEVAARPRDMVGRKFTTPAASNRLCRGVDLCASVGRGSLRGVHPTCSRG